MLEDLQKNIERLIALYEGEKQERLRLSAELDESRAQNESLTQQIDRLERQVDNLKLKEAFTASAGSPQAKERLDKLTKEIDKCISMLER